METNEKLAMISAMRHYGGSFVQALAECFSVADANNLSKLELAFPEYVKSYIEMSKTNEAKGWFDQHG